MNKQGFSIKLLGLLVLASCVVNQEFPGKPVNQGRKKRNLLGEVKECWVYSYKPKVLIDAKDNIQTDDTSLYLLESRKYFMYNSDGREVIRESQNGKGTHKRKYTSTYNDKGSILRHETFNADTLFSFYEYEYDEFGYPKGYLGTDVGDTCSTKIKMKYQYGVMALKDAKYCNGNHLVDKMTINKYGRRLAYFIKNENGKIQLREKCRYNDSQMVECKGYSDKGDLTSLEVAYDSLNGKLRVVSKKYYKDKAISKTERWVYDENDWLISIRTNSKDPFDFSRTKVFKYDDLGNRTHDYEKTSNGEMILKIERAYDSIGNRTMEAYYYDDGSLKNQTITTYYPKVGFRFGFKTITQVSDYREQTWHYDSNGTELKYVSVNTNSNQVEIERYSIIEYDESGNWLKNVIVENGQVNSMEIRRFNYFE